MSLLAPAYDPAPDFTLQRNPGSLTTDGLGSSFSLHPTQRELALSYGADANWAMREIAFQQKYVFDHERSIAHFEKHAGEYLNGNELLADHRRRLGNNQRELARTQDYLQFIAQQYESVGLADYRFNETTIFGAGELHLVQGRGLATAADAFGWLNNTMPGLTSTGDDLMFTSGLFLGPAKLLGRVGVAGAAASEVSGLPILNANFTPNAARVMQNLAAHQSRNLAADLTLAQNVLSTAEYAAATNSFGVARMQFGNAMERMMARDIRNDPEGLGSLFVHIGGPGRYDFAGIGPAQGHLFELTTRAAMRAHEARWYGDLVHYSTYGRPEDFALFPPVR